MNVFVTGCGKTGSELAVKLCELGHDVMVIDADSRKLENLPNDFGGLTYCGIPIDEDILNKAGIADCDVLFAVSDDDNANLMIAQLAKNVFGVEKVIARVDDSSKEAFFSTLGFITVCPTNLTVGSLVSSLGEFKDDKCFSMGNHTIKMFSIPVPEDFYGEEASEITLEENETLFAVIAEDGTARIVNDYNFILNKGETLVFSKLID